MPAPSVTMGNLALERVRRRFRAVFSWYALCSGRFWRLSAALVALFAPACAGAPGPDLARAPLAAPAPAEAGAPSALDRAWGKRVLWHLPLELELPDARAWHATESGSFTLLEHARSHSKLTLRLTLASRLVRPEACEAAARLARPSLPLGDVSSVVERRVLGSPAGFDTRLVVGVEPAPSGHVRGWAIAFGAATSRCFVAAFETESSGARAAEEVAERLASVVSGVFETWRIPIAEGRVFPPPGVK